MFTRIAIGIVLFNVFLNAGAVALADAGVGRTHGIDAAPGGDTSGAEAAAAQAQSPGGGGQGTLFGLRYFLGGLVGSIVNAVPAAATLKAVGVPAILVDFLYAGQALVVGIATLSFFRTGGGL